MSNTTPRSLDSLAGSTPKQNIVHIDSIIAAEALEAAPFVLGKQLSLVDMSLDIQQSLLRILDNANYLEARKAGLSHFQAAHLNETVTLGVPEGVQIYSKGLIDYIGNRASLVIGDLRERNRIALNGASVDETPHEDVAVATVKSCDRAAIHVDLGGKSYHVICTNGSARVAPGSQVKIRLPNRKEEKELRRVAGKHFTDKRLAVLA